MLWKNNRKKYTFIVLSNRPELPVRRTGISRLTLGLAIFHLMLAIALGLGWLHSIRSAANHNIDLLEQSIEEKNVRYGQLAEEKDHEIDRLRTDVVQITEQNKLVQRKMEQLKLLQQELSELLDQSADELSAFQLPEKVAQPPASASALAQGGELQNIETEQWSQFFDQSVSSAQLLQQEIDNLSINLSLLKSNLQAYIQQKKTTPDHWPAVSRQINSLYGIRSDPITGRAAFHDGVDIAGVIDDPVFTAAAGEVGTVGFDRLKGNFLTIKHSSEVETVYMHLQQVAVQPGQTVEKGERIGTIGNSGRSTGPHLHFEIHHKNKPMDPMTYYK